MFKKSLAVAVILGFLSPVVLAGEGSLEHLETNKKFKDLKTNLVNVSSYGNVIQKDNFLVVNFAQNFNSKYYKHGDYVQFSFDNDIKTQEGSLIIPKGASLIARISEIEEPEWFSKNAKVFLEFIKIIFPNGQEVPVSLQISGKKRFLQKGAKETAGKIAGYTLSIGGVGAGLGAAIGVAAGHTITGLIIGGSIGGGVGLLSGIVSPGLHYKAKQGQPLVLELRNDLNIPTDL